MFSTFKFRCFGTQSSESNTKGASHLGDFWKLAPGYFENWDLRNAISFDLGIDVLSGGGGGETGQEE